MAPTTRWHGRTIGTGLRFITVPTARAARGFPDCAASVPYVVVVPYGEVTTYGALAARADRPRAARAVGTVMNRNPIPIVLPCHRVIGASGSLTGYGGGLDKKEHLLRLEGAIL